MNKVRIYVLRIEEALFVNNTDGLRYYPELTLVSASPIKVETLRDPPSAGDSLLHKMLAQASATFLIEGSSRLWMSHKTMGENGPVVVAEAYASPMRVYSGKVTYALETADVADAIARKLMPRETAFESLGAVDPEVVAEELTDIILRRANIQIQSEIGHMLADALRKAAEQGLRMAEQQQGPLRIQTKAASEEAFIGVAATDFTDVALCDAHDGMQRFKVLRVAHESSPRYVSDASVPGFSGYWEFDKAVLARPDGTKVAFFAISDLRVYVVTGGAVTPAGSMAIPVTIYRAIAGEPDPQRTMSGEQALEYTRRHCISPATDTPAKPPTMN